MTTAGKVLAQARGDIGMRGRPNAITRDYASRNGAAFLRAAWCNMGTTKWLRDAGGFAAGYCWGKDYAYTVWNAQEGQRRGRWRYGVAGIQAGDLVFFDWSAGRSIGGIDHVGIVEKVLSGGRIQTIEANTGDACLRRVRSGAVITGYIRPEYTGVSAPPPSGGGGGYQGYEARNTTAKPGERVLRMYSNGADVETVQKIVGVDDDGKFGPDTTRAVKDYQKRHGLDDDGVVGPKTWAKMGYPKASKPKGKPFPLPAGHWFGTPAADERNHSGYHWTGDRPPIRDIQGVVGAKKDGKYGPDTARRVKAWQKRHGLKDDSLVGVKTWSKMFGGS